MTENVHWESSSRLGTDHNSSEVSNDDLASGVDESKQIEDDCTSQAKLKMKYSELRIIIISVVAAIFFILLLYLAVTTSVIILRAHNRQENSNHSIEDEFSNERYADMAQQR